MHRQSAGSDGTVKKQPVKKAIRSAATTPVPAGSGMKWKKCTCKEYHPELRANAGSPVFP
ncbi:MAG: hypothetical protein ACLRWQ_16875 [Flavonifractor plautii]